MIHFNYMSYIQLLTFTPTRPCSLACRSRIKRRACKVWWVLERPRSKADLLLT